MEREVLFLVLSLASLGTAMWGAAAFTGTPSRPGPSEVQAWRQLVRPFLVGGLFLAFFVGWAVQESDPSDEWAGAAWHMLAALVGAVALRALWRGLRSWHATAETRHPIVTVGLARPHIRISEEFRRNASREVLAAALAHEAAHARGRDPLRILIAQIIADLQWPVPGVRRRLKAWLFALEMRRDDEAIEAGASPLELAEGILLAARLGAGKPEGLPVASMAGDGESLTLRVHRLLRGGRRLEAQETARARWRGWIYLTMLAASAVMGLLHGDLVLGLIPGVSR